MTVWKGIFIVGYKQKYFFLKKTIDNICITWYNYHVSKERGGKKMTEKEIEKLISELENERLYDYGLGW